jgi:hypothetical protein
VISKDELIILDEFAIPSSYTLMDVVVARPDEKSRYQSKLAVILEEREATVTDKLVSYMQAKDESQKRIDQFKTGLKSHGRQMPVNLFVEDLMKQPDADIYPEKHLKQCLPTFTHRDLDSPNDGVLSKDKERNKARDRRLKTITGTGTG